MDLRGKRVLLTGASRGMGRIMAAELAGAGARLALVARSREGLEEVAASLPSASVHPCDLADALEVDGLIGRVEAEGGPVDVLVNNAGLAHAGDLLAAGPGAMRQLFQVNLLTPAELCRQVLPGMLDRGSGHVVNMSSLAGVAAFPGMAAYASTKAGLTQLTAALRADLRNRPIGTTLVEVGPVPTEMLEEIDRYEPLRRSFARFAHLRLLIDTPPQRVAHEVVAAVTTGRRHVRLPRRAAGFAMLHEAPRRLTEVLLTRVPHQG